MASYKSTERKHPIMKKTLCLILALAAVCLLALNAFAAGLSFSDVKATDWFAEAVSEAVALGLINGKGTDASGKNRFDPNGNITLAEAVKLAACMNQLSAEGAVTLTNGSPWYESYADYGKKHFLTASGKGFSYDSVMAAPNQIINRAQFAWLFAHAVPASALPEVNAIPDNAIPDVKSGTEPYYDEIYTLYRAGIINGSDKNGSFLPASNIKRSEVAAIVVRMMEPERRVGPPANLAAAPALDLTTVIAANRLSALAERYGTVKVHDSDKYFDTDSWFFLDGGTVVKITESVSKTTGASVGLNVQVGDLLYMINEDGSVTGRGFVRAYAPAENTENDSYLVNKLLGGTLDELAETNDGYAFRVSTSWNGYRCAVDKSTLSLSEIRDESGDFLCTVEYGAKLPSFAETYKKAMEKTRTVILHASRGTETYDWVYTVPTAWDFYFDAGEMAVYADAAHTVFAGSSVPADGKNYEFWCVDGTD